MNDEQCSAVRELAEFILELPDNEVTESLKESAHIALNYLDN